MVANFAYRLPSCAWHELPDAQRTHRINRGQALKSRKVLLGAAGSSIRGPRMEKEPGAFLSANVLRSAIRKLAESQSRVRLLVSPVRVSANVGRISGRRGIGREAESSGPIWHSLEKRRGRGTGEGRERAAWARGRVAKGVDLSRCEREGFRGFAGGFRLKLIAN